MAGPKQVAELARLVEWDAVLFRCCRKYAILDVQDQGDLLLEVARPGMRLRNKLAECRRVGGCRGQRNVMDCEDDRANRSDACKSQSDVPAHGIE